MTTGILDPRVIHTTKEYQAAMAEIYRLLDLKPRKESPEDQRLELLTLLVEDYETRTEPEIPPGKPQSIVEFMLEQKGLSRSDLVQPLGGRSRVSEFFAGKRPLSTNQIRALRDLLGIPADLLLEPAEEAGLVTEVASMEYHGAQAAKQKSSFFGAYKVHGKQRGAKSNPRVISAAAKVIRGVKKGTKAAKKK